jgi:hypothetical protein
LTVTRSLGCQGPGNIDAVAVTDTLAAGVGTSSSCPAATRDRKTALGKGEHRTSPLWFEEMARSGDGSTRSRYVILPTLVATVGVTAEPDGGPGTVGRATLGESPADGGFACSAID